MEKKEEKALDALIALALNPGLFSGPPTEEEIKEFMENPPELSKEDQKAIDNLPDSVFDFMKKKPKA